MTTTISMHLPYLREFPMKFGEKRKDLYTTASSCPFSSQFHFIHESNKLKKSFTYKDKQNHLRRSSIFYKLTCTCGSNYIGQTPWNLITWMNKHKFDERYKVCKYLLSNPMHRFNFKQTGDTVKHCQSKGTSPTRVSCNTGTLARS